MKNIFTLSCLLFAIGAFAQQTYTVSIVSSSFQDGTPVNAGDTVTLYTQTTGYASSETDSVLVACDIMLGSGIGAYEPTDGKFFVWSQKMKYTDYLKITPKNINGIGYTVREIKITVPKNYPTGLFIVQMLAGSSPVTSSTGSVIGSISAVLNPLEEKNKNIEFDFYNQNGVFISHCKFSDLRPGFYLANGYKFLKSEN